VIFFCIAVGLDAEPVERLIPLKRNITNSY
jgi:hypothetical protein